MAVGVYIGPRRREFRHREEGSAILELAAIIPIITILGLGVLEFSNFFFQYQLVQNGVRDASRYAASLPYDSANKTQNDTRIKNLAVTGQPTGGTARVKGWTTSNVTITWATVANPNVTTGGSTAPSYNYTGAVPVVTVAANVPYSPLGFLGFMRLGSLSIKAKHQERVIGVR